MSACVNARLNPPPSFLEDPDLSRELCQLAGSLAFVWGGNRHAGASEISSYCLFVKIFLSNWLISSHFFQLIKWLKPKKYVILKHKNLAKHLTVNSCIF